MCRTLMLLLAILVSLAAAQSLGPDPDLDPETFINNTVPALTREVEKLRDTMFAVQDKIAEVANSQGIPIPVPQLNLSGSQLLLVPVTNSMQLVKDFTETVNDANLKILEAQIDTLQWTVDTTVQLHNTLVSNLRNANDMLTDINNQLLKSATAPLRAMQSQLEDSIETIQDFLEDVSGVSTVADAVDDLFDSFGW